jgi:Na+(H+)/acetate symporter ActP
MQNMLRPVATQHILKALDGVNPEPEMSIALLAVVGFALVAVGMGVTFMIASAVPQDMLQRAQNNGRYAGLTADDQNGGSGKRIDAGRPQLGNQVINAI